MGEKMDYTSNSYKSREKNDQETTVVDKPKVQKVVSGQVVTKKHSQNRLKDIFISKDAATIKEYIIYDLIVPTIKRIIVGSLDIALNGDRGSSYRYGSEKITYRDYASISKAPARDTYRAASDYYYDEFIIPDMGEAKAALSQLDDILATYHFVSVADLCETVGVSSKYTDNDYGWTDLRDAKIVRRGGGYVIDLPPASPSPFRK